MVVASHAVASSVSQRRRQPPLSRSSSPVGREEGHNVVPMVEAADSLPAGNARQQQTSALGRPRTAALGSCGRAPHYIAVRSSPARANGSTAAPSVRRTMASARHEIRGDWASVGRLAWWFLRPSATRRVFFLFQPEQRKRQTPSTQHRAAGAVGRPAPALRSPAPPPPPPPPPPQPLRPSAVGRRRIRALGTARHRGDLQGCSRPPPATASALGTRRPRWPPAVPARCAACAAPRRPPPRSPAGLLAPPAGLFVTWLRHLPWRWVDKGAARGSINAWRSAHSPSLG
ncbi:hypothetical protein PVAP13_9NG147719 [Panicum virgatum]|uniref:Uncharacterized protein n=1 Tax=Panicum virgatum TaxID=38727 RepID=A0A8T0MF81_PANVG|nr:hypothetical protein PVAP13_9NG147719 [Panicum virgatum]